MKYMGSKSRIAKYILPIILENRTEGQWYVEPFVGGGNLIDKVDGNRIGADINNWVIDALNAIKSYIHYLPRDKTQFTEQDYKQLFNSNCDYAWKGYAGFAFSYAGKWLGGWRRDSSNKRDYIAESYRSAVKQSPKLKYCIFIKSSYKTLNFPKNSIIYLDPPYKGTTNYRNDFDHDELFEWCREMKKEGHTIFLSEYEAPDDFICVWSMKVNSSLYKDTGGKKAIEKLFTL